MNLFSADHRQAHESIKTMLTYHNATELDTYVTKLAQSLVKYISIAEPILDAARDDGSRSEVVIDRIRNDLYFVSDGSAPTSSVSE